MTKSIGINNPKLDKILYGVKRSQKPSRTLGIRDRQILYRKAKMRCENPTCRKKIEFDEMQAGHKFAASKGGTITVKTAKCLCYRCNKLQGTDSWDTFLRKQGINVKKTSVSSTKKRKPRESDSPFANPLRW